MLHMDESDWADNAVAEFVKPPFDRTYDDFVQEFRSYIALIFRVEFRKYTSRHLDLFKHAE